MQKKRSVFDRRLLYLVLVVLFVVAVIVGWNEAVEVVGILLRCAPGYLALAVLAQAGFFLAQNGVYEGLCQAVGLPYRYRDLLLLTVTWPFINVTVPAGGLAGVAVLADDARQRDLEPERAIVAGMGYLISMYAAFGVIIWVALYYLREKGLLYPYQIAAGIAHGLGLAGMGLLLFLAGCAPDILARILDFIAAAGRWLARLVRRSAPSPAATLAPMVVRAHQAVRRAAHRPGQLALVVLWSTAAQGANLLSLWLVVRSLGRQISLLQLMAVYGISYLVSLVSPTPQGIGFTEGATVAIFSSLGASFEGSVAIAMAFRGVTFWLPFLTGFVVVRRLRTFQNGRLNLFRHATANQPASSSHLEPPAE